MKNQYKLLLTGSILLTFSLPGFATSCPDVGNYRLTSHDRNNQHCTYTSHGRGQMGIQGTKATHHCPRFILTDPHFRQSGSCHVVIKSAAQNLGNHRNVGTHCQCTIEAIP